MKKKVIPLILSASLLIGAGVATAIGPSFSISANTALPSKSEKISKENPLVLANNWTVIKISGVDYQANNTRANFYMIVTDDYGETSKYRIGKVKGKDELADLLDYYVWNMHD